MMTTEFIVSNFRKHAQIGGDRWEFRPFGGGEGLNTHRYYLNFYVPERRFLLSRQRIVPYETVADDEMLKAFRGTLTDEEVASCIMRAIQSPPEDDPIPF